MNLPIPSIVFKKILPVNPSAITTSIPPKNASLPSTFPTKLISKSGLNFFNNLYEFLINSFPLVSSVPMFNKPILGFSTPTVVVM